MLLILGAFIIISIFELRYLYKTKEKKEASIYIIISVITVGLAVFLMLVPDYKTLSKLLLSLTGNGQ